MLSIVPPIQILALPALIADRGGCLWNEHGFMPPSHLLDEDIPASRLEAVIDAVTLEAITDLTCRYAIVLTSIPADSPRYPVVGYCHQYYLCWGQIIVMLRDIYDTSEWQCAIGALVPLALDCSQEKGFVDGTIGHVISSIQLVSESPGETWTFRRGISYLILIFYQFDGSTYLPNARSVNLKSILRLLNWRGHKYTHTRHKTLSDGRSGPLSVESDPNPQRCEQSPTESARSHTNPKYHIVHSKTSVHQGRTKLRNRTKRARPQCDPLKKLTGFFASRAPVPSRPPMEPTHATPSLKKKLSKPPCESSPRTTPRGILQMEQYEWYIPFLPLPPKS